MNIWRQLTAEEAKEFRQWARDNFKVNVDAIDEMWHPIVIAECYLMIAEQYIID